MIRLRLADNGNVVLGGSYHKSTLPVRYWAYGATHYSAFQNLINADLSIRVVRIIPATYK